MHRISDIMQRAQGPAALQRFLPQAAAEESPVQPERSQPAGGIAPGAPQGRRDARGDFGPVSGGSFSQQLEQMIERQSSQLGVNSDLVRAVVRQESGGNPRAVSRAGAVGLMQLMPDTARQLGVDPYDPEENLQGGIRYLRDMASQFQSVDQALAAYNAGPGAVRRYGGTPPYQETQNYVQSIRRMLRNQER